MFKGGGGYDFSYSGLKTAVINYCHTKEQKGEEIVKADVAASFQKAAVDVMIKKTIAAAKEKRVKTVTAGASSPTAICGRNFPKPAGKTACASFFPKSATAPITRR